MPDKSPITYRVYRLMKIDSVSCYNVTYSALRQKRPKTGDIAHLTMYRPTIYRHAIYYNRRGIIRHDIHHQARRVPHLLHFPVPNFILPLHPQNPATPSSPPTTSEPPQNISGPGSFFYAATTALPGSSKSYKNAWYIRKKRLTSHPVCGIIKVP